MEIKFDKFLYTMQAVKKAMLEYEKLGDFCCKEKKNYIIVKINRIKGKELKPLFSQEFSNYVLSLVGALK